MEFDPKYPEDIFPFQDLPAGPGDQDYDVPQFDMDMPNAPYQEYNQSMFSLTAPISIPAPAPASEVSYGSCESTSPVSFENPGYLTILEEPFEPSVMMGLISPHDIFAATSFSPPAPKLTGTASGTNVTRRRRASSLNEKRLTCPHCPKSFRRTTDTKRHINTVHFPTKVDCHFPDCTRKGENGFSRKDHHYEHLREFHGDGPPKKRNKETTTIA